MLDRELKLVIGSLLHDIGKIVYRTGDMRKHSISGYETIKEMSNLNDETILEQIKYHHADAINNAKLSDDSLAYITYIADNIASGMDRRKSIDQIYEGGFDKNIGLSSIFNIINENDQSYVYQPRMLNTEEEINYPSKQAAIYDRRFYESVLRNIADNLKGIVINDEYINSLLEVMEANTSFIPSSTNLSEISDISLFDHVKLTAAVASSISKYLDENQIKDYRDVLYKNSKDFYSQDAFMMFSMDISGIQDFIYTVTSDGALKSLRARSFYLEILMEHLIDELLQRVGLSRANLLYSGGGHAYILLSNTKQHNNIVNQYIEEVNQWFMNQYGTALYIAAGMASCSANDLGYAYGEEGNHQYKNIFHKMSKDISNKKMARYSATDIWKLNKQEDTDDTRECRVCHRADLLNEDDVCEICQNIKNISNGILNDSFFSIVGEKPDQPNLVLPFDRYMVSDNKEKLIKRIKEDNDYIRTYGKNKFYTGDRIATKLWVGDYVNGNTFEELAENATGIKRIAVLRADVDNLGKAFVSGFESKKQGDKFVGLSRTTTFSRKMSIFFKNHINQLLENGEFYLDQSTKSGKRNAVIVYAGGDDVFVIGSWDDIIGFAVDLHQAFQAFTQGMLTISAGIGIYPSKYPVIDLANQTGKLESASKGYEDLANGKRKNAITLFDTNLTFSWDDFIQVVLEDKFKTIENYFSHPLSRGKGFIYHLLELMRDESEDRINLARLAYTLSRLEPEVDKDKTETKEAAQRYDTFKRMVYESMRDKKETNEVTTALMLYVYLIRES